MLVLVRWPVIGMVLQASAWNMKGLGCGSVDPGHFPLIGKYEVQLPTVYYLHENLGKISGDLVEKCW